MNITFTLSVDETNIILASLAKQPFETVAELIGKLRTEADKQIKDAEESSVKEE